MDGEVLLHWMTYLGEGSWSSFRNAAAKMAGPEADINALCRRLRIALSDLGHADFFVEGSQRWRVLPPVLAGLPPSSERAVLTGGRTPKLSDGLASVAAGRGCSVLIENTEDYPASVSAEGKLNVLASVATEVGIPYIENFALTLCASIKPIQIETAPVEEAPGNWSVQSFDFGLMKWVEGLRGRSACEFRSQYGSRRFYLHIRRGHLRRLGKREAVYAAAMIRGVSLVDYDPATATLSVPASAPLPELYARAACLCSGAPAAPDKGRLIYKNVPHNVAAILLVAAGQPYPEPQVPSSMAARNAEWAHE